MMRTDEVLMLKSGEASIEVRGMHGVEPARVHQHMAGAATELEKASSEKDAAVAAHMSARREVGKAPALLSAKVRAAVVVVAMLERGVTTPEESPFDSEDPTVYADEVAAALEGDDPLLTTIAEALRSAVAEYERLLESYEAAVKRMQAAVQRHEMARKELTAWTAKAQALITRATPQKAFGRQYRRKPARRSPRVAPNLPSPEPAESPPAVSAPGPSNGTPAGAPTGVSPEVVSPPTPPA